MLMWTSEQKSNLMFISARASQLAEQVHPGEAARAKLKRKRTHTVDDSKSKDKHHNKNNFEQSNKRHRSGKLGNGNNSKKKKRGSNDEWNHPCLNKEEWSYIHKIMDCPITSAERKNELPS